MKKIKTVREQAEKWVFYNVSWGSQDDGVLELETIKAYLAGYKAGRQEGVCCPKHGDKYRTCVSCIIEAAKKKKWEKK